jgi:hypothetical protein
VFPAVADKPVGAAGAVAVTVVVKVLLADAYKTAFVGVKVAVIVEVPAAINATVAPPLTGLTVVELVFELV